MGGLRAGSPVRLFSAFLFIYLFVCFRYVNQMKDHASLSFFCTCYFSTKLINIKWN